MNFVVRSALVGLGVVAVPYVLDLFLASKAKVPTPASSAILMTGASSGIGRHSALSLVREGFTVFAGVRKQKDADSLISEAQSPLMIPIILDVAKEEHIESAFSEVSETLQQRGLNLAALVNNAGIAQGSMIEITDLKIVRQMFDVNFFGIVALTQKFLPLIRSAKGRVVMIGSGLGRVSFPSMGYYSATKFALEAASDALRVELRPWGIPVSIVEPGWIKTNIEARARSVNAAARAAAAAATAAASASSSSSSSLYDAAVSRCERAVTRFMDGASPVQLTTDAIASAITSSYPAPRYLVGADAKWFVPIFATLLPTRVRDFVVERMMY